MSDHTGPPTRPEEFIEPLAGFAAFGVIFLNGNFVLAGALGSNPVLITLGALLVVAWRNAGWIGLDRWLLPIAQRRSVQPPVLASVGEG